MTRKPERKGAEEATPEGGLPYLRFYHSLALRTRTLTVLDALETAEEATSHRRELADVVLELTQTGLEYYFVKPVQAANVGFMAEQSTKLGIGSILRLMGPVVRQVIGGMDARQLRVVAAHIHELMR